MSSDPPQLPIRTLPLYSSSCSSLQHGRAAFVFTASKIDDMLSLHDTNTGDKIISIHAPEQNPTAIAVAHDGIKCAFGTATGAIYIWDALDPTSMESFRPHNEDLAPVTDLVWHPRGHVLAVATADGALYLWDLVVGTLLYPVNAHQGPISAVRWTADGKLLVTAGLTDSALRLWHPRNVANLAELSSTSEDTNDIKWPTTGITAMDTLVDMSRVAITGGQDGSVLLSVFKPESMCGVFHAMSPHKTPVTALQFAPLDSPKPLRAASGSQDGIIHLFDMDRRFPMGDFDHAASVTQLQFSDHAQVLFSAGGDTVMAWDARVAPEEEAPVTFGGHPAPVEAFAVINDGTNLVTACEDGGLRTFDMRYPAGQLVPRGPEVK